MFTQTVYPTGSSAMSLFCRRACLFLLSLALFATLGLTEAQGQIIIILQDPAGKSPAPDSTVVNVYPVPTSDVLNVEPDPGVTISELEIYDTSGGLVFSTLVSGPEDFPVTLPTGVYYLHLSTSSGEVVRYIQVIDP